MTAFTSELSRISTGRDNVTWKNINVLDSDSIAAVIGGLDVLVSTYQPGNAAKDFNDVAGNHGAGVVAKVGKEVSLKPGTFVAFSYYNTWPEYAAVPAEWLIPLPSNYPIEKAGQLVNPITAWDLLNQSGVQPGEWLVVTAGHSASIARRTESGSSRCKGRAARPGPPNWNRAVGHSGNADLCASLR